ncbi:hypothetical protein BDR05DRAFT_961335 [Suillus weaverae]|nr:hypothetical protein BDR05DRAFT_961335 [Suillus weaverae]
MADLQLGRKTSLKRLVSNVECHSRVAKRSPFSSASVILLLISATARTEGRARQAGTGSHIQPSYQRHRLRRPWEALKNSTPSVRLGTEVFHFVSRRSKCAIPFVINMLIQAQAEKISIFSVPSLLWCQYCIN